MFAQALNVDEGGVDEVLLEFRLHRPRGVAVSTQDSESCDGSSNLPGACVFAILNSFQELELS